LLEYGVYVLSMVDNMVCTIHGGHGTANCTNSCSDGTSGPGLVSRAQGRMKPNETSIELLNNLKSSVLEPRNQELVCKLQLPEMNLSFYSFHFAENIVKN